ncbi:MmgE/PrpD family protein [Xanthobacteraceae bacterium Astr-EGSB]|uniref:MmgE/PrpD family protein n=1 Tax=Astrobacterium formosum TaxID=3069710 RepID=UPI0027B0037A|nr:MmgE/PrpD family protein [Xanthobacteraceae bacterium Astr-EGSB]
MTEQHTFTEHLACVCRDIAQEHVPVEVMDKAKLCLLDHLSALLYGTRSPIADVGRGVRDALGQGSSALIADTRTASLLGAAFYHGLISTAEDLDDSHRFAGGLHVSAITIPAALALAEERQVSGERFLRAVIAGHEISARICRAVDAGLRARGWHSTGAVGPYGACAASCVVLDLDQATIANALGVAASGAGGLFAFLHEGVSVRHVHGAWASANGLGAALLAAAGMTGPLKVLEGKDGYLAAYATASDPTFIQAPLPTVGGKYEILNAYHKLYACCGHAYPSLTAAFSLRQDLSGRLDEIQSIEARVYKASAALTNPDPHSVQEAKFSLPFLLAMAFVTGDLSLRGICMQNIGDPRVQALAARVRVIEDPVIAANFPRLRSAELLVAMKDGQIIRQYVDAPLGMPENPVGWRELEDKFRDAAHETFEPCRVQETIETVSQLDKASTIDGLIRLLKV